MLPICLFPELIANYRTFSQVRLHQQARSRCRCHVFRPFTRNRQHAPTARRSARTVVGVCQICLLLTIDVMISPVVRILRTHTMITSSNPWRQYRRAGVLVILSAREPV